MACYHLPSVQCDECRGLRTMISVPADGLAVVYEENKMLREELADARARHRDYSSGIAEAIGHERPKRETGEPARSDRAEIEELKRERILLKQRVDDLKFALGTDAAGWFAKYKTATSQCDLLHSALSDLAEGDCSYDDGCPSTGTRPGQCYACKARQALSEAKS